MSKIDFKQCCRDFVNAYLFDGVTWEKTGTEHVYIYDTGRFEKMNLYVICDWRKHHISPNISFVFAYSKEKAIDEYVQNKV